MRFWKKQSEFTPGLFAALAGLAFVLVFMEPTPLEIRVDGVSIDQWCADAFYWNGIHRWFVDGENPLGKVFFYNGPKALIIATAVGFGVFALTPGRFMEKLRVRFPWIPARRNALIITLCLALIPIACNRAKAVTNIYCPYEHTRYGGHAPYARLWDDYPAEFKAVQRANPRERGRGFPAGHASGGFALMSLALAFRRRRLIGVAIGTFAGWWMGLYQMAKGAHYLSHTLVTWCVAWIMIWTLTRLIRPEEFAVSAKA